MNDTNVLQFVGRIYDTALQPLRWNDVVDEFAELISAGSASIQVIDPNYTENQNSTLSKHYREHPDMDVLGPAYYEEVWLKEAKAYEALFKAESPGFLSDYECMGFSDASFLEQHSPSLWMRDNFNTFNRIASRLNSTAAWRDVIAVQYHASRGEATVEEVAFANQFIPHLARAVEMGRDFSVLQGRFNTVLCALDHYHVAIWFVSYHGDVQMLNEAASRILEQKDGIGRDLRGKLCVTTKASIDLDKAIQVCSATAQGEGLDNERLLTVSRRSGKSSYLMTVAPMRDPGNEIETQYKGVIVYAIDPENIEIISTKGMADIYGLTAAEDEVCNLLVQGYSSKEIAERREVSIETVRTQN